MIIKIWMLLSSKFNYGRVVSKVVALSGKGKLGFNGWLRLASCLFKGRVHCTPRNSRARTGPLPFEVAAHYGLSISQVALGSGGHGWLCPLRKCCEMLACHEWYEDAGSVLSSWSRNWESFVPEGGLRYLTREGIGLHNIVDLKQRGIVECREGVAAWNESASK